MAISHIKLGSGVSAAYREAGIENSGTIVQIHGLGTGHNNFDLLTPQLSKRLHTYDMHLPGYGESECEPGERGITYFADSVAQFIEALELAPVHVHGTSMQSSPSGLGMTDLHRLIPDSKQDMLENCGHFISIERPAETARAIADFLLVAE